MRPWLLIVCAGAALLLAQAPTIPQFVPGAGLVVANGVVSIDSAYIPFRVNGQISPGPCQQPVSSQTFGTGVWGFSAHGVRNFYICAPNSKGNGFSWWQSTPFVETWTP